MKDIKYQGTSVQGAYAMHSLLAVYTAANNDTNQELKIDVGVSACFPCPSNHL